MRMIHGLRFILMYICGIKAVYAFGELRLRSGTDGLRFVTFSVA